MSDHNLGPGIVSITRIPCSYNDCTTKSSVTWDSINEHVCNQPSYGRAYAYNYSLIIGCHNNCIIMHLKFPLVILKENMMIFMLAILHARVTIFSDFLYPCINFQKTLIFMDKSFLLVKWYANALALDS